MSRAPGTARGSAASSPGDPATNDAATNDAATNGAATAHPAATSFAQRLTSRAGARWTLVLAILVAALTMGALGQNEGNIPVSGPPTGSESVRAAELARALPGADIQPVLIVATAPDGRSLTPADLSEVTRLAGAASGHAAGPASPAVPSQDGRAAAVQVPIRPGETATETADTIAAVRTALHDTPHTLTYEVTGGPAFGADIAAAFDGANLRLLLVTVGIVAFLLLLTYRSPVLWLIPLAVVGLADQLAGTVTGRLGTAFDLTFDVGIVSVLVFGAGANYALLLISRYREELARYADHRAALARAWRATVPAILASNATVVLALLTLALAVLPGTRGLGLASAAGLLIALAAILFVLPAALAMCGRRVFWPFIPRPEATGAARTSADRSRWASMARAVVRRPAAVVSVVSLVLLSLTAGLLGTQVGLSQTERFRVASESAAGLDTLSRHFPAGDAAPMTVLTATAAAPAVRSAATAVSGVVRVTDATATPEVTELSVVGAFAPGTDESLNLVRELRAAVHPIEGAQALVGGAVAEDLDTRDAADRDLRVVVPIVLALTGLVLLILTRSVVAAGTLLVVNVLGSAATIGAGAWATRELLDAPALDVQVPLLAFLFLVALGIDYTIFLVHRVRAEAAELGTLPGVVRAVGGTGVVITSAGLVLAAVFAALGVLPLVTLGQLGLIVGLGVILDTFVVRTLLVPGLIALLGDRFWWPSRPRATVTASDPPSEPAPDPVADPVADPAARQDTPPIEAYPG